MINLSNSDIEDFYIKVGEKVKTLRKTKGYTSYETFALDFDFDRKQYWRIEKGMNITLKTLVKITNIHNISLSEFFQDL
jgi:transcriptional regulator with XRE-family HTH domain